MENLNQKKIYGRKNNKTKNKITLKEKAKIALNMYKPFESALLRRYSHINTLLADRNIKT